MSTTDRPRLHHLRNSYTQDRAMNKNNAVHYTPSSSKVSSSTPRWDVEAEELRSCQLSALKRVVVLITAFGSLFGMAVYFSRAVPYRVTHNSSMLNDERLHQPELRNCGNSSSEAEALGCRFQLWSYAWVPEPCFDEKLDRDWIEMQPQPSPTGWHYFEDIDGTRAVDVDVVLKGKSSRLYTTWGQHLWHCAFTWRKVLRNLNGSGVKLTERDLQYDHTVNCSDMAVLGSDWGFDVINDMLTLGFLECKV